MAEWFGQYRLEGIISREGRGEVYRAFDSSKERMVAVKRLPPELTADTEFVARFRRDLAMAAQLSDPHVIPIHDYGEIDGHLFVDMRLISGVSLAEVVAHDGPLSPNRAVRIVAQVARALDAAHSAGLLHLDIRPSNVILTGSGDDEFAYLTDFGAAEIGTGSTATMSEDFETGPFDYTAPERFGTGTIDRRADVYSLGCVLFEVLTGETPFPAVTDPGAINSHLHQDPPRASTKNPQVPAALDDVVLRALAKNPDDRYPTATALTTAAHNSCIQEVEPDSHIPPTAVSGRPRGLDDIRAAAAASSTLIGEQTMLVGVSSGSDA